MAVTPSGLGAPSGPGAPSGGAPGTMGVTETYSRTATNHLPPAGALQAIASEGLWGLTDRLGDAYWALQFALENQVRTQPYLYLKLSTSRKLIITMPLIMSPYNHAPNHEHDPHYGKTIEL